MANSEPFFYFLIIPRDFLQERSYDWLSALKLFGHHTLIRKVFCQAVPYWGQGLRIRLELIRVWPSRKNRIQPLRKTRYRSDPNRMNFTIEICTKTILIFSTQQQKFDFRGILNLEFQTVSKFWILLMVYIDKYRHLLLFLFLRTIYHRLWFIHKWSDI